MNCSMKCGHCKRKKHCNHITGICKKGCKEGFQGDKCNKGTLNVIEIIIFKRLVLCVCVKKRFCLKINHVSDHWGRFYEIHFFLFFVLQNVIWTCLDKIVQANVDIVLITKRVITLMESAWKVVQLGSSGQNAIQVSIYN